MESSSSAPSSDPLDKIKLPQDYNSDEYRIQRVMSAMRPIVLKISEIFSRDEFVYLCSDVRLIGYIYVLKKYEFGDHQNIPMEFFTLLKRNFQQYASNDVDIIKKHVPNDVFDLAQQQKFLNDFRSFMSTLHLCFP